MWTHLATVHLFDHGTNYACHSQLYIPSFLKAQVDAFQYTAIPTIHREGNIHITNQTQETIDYKTIIHAL